MTIFGKAFVFLIVCLSLFTLSVAIWLFVDKRDWRAEHNAIGQEIYNRQAALDKERGAMIVLLDEIGKGSRQMPWDPETDAKPTSVRETRKQVDDISKEVDQLFNEQNNLHVQIQQSYLTELAKARQEYDKSIAEQKNLRQQIKPENPNEKGFRDLTAEHRAAKEAAELAQENLKPDIFNELVRVALVKARLDELAGRLKELQGK